MGTVWVSAELKDRGSIRRNIFKKPPGETLSDLYDKFDQDEKPERRIVARIYDNKKPDIKRDIPLNAPVTLLPNFSANSVQFEHIYNSSVPQDTSSTLTNGLDLAR